jgi:hypothetical protein
VIAPDPVETLEIPAESQSPGDLASDAGEPQTAASTSTSEVTPQNEETDLMSNRSSPSPDFSGDFSFLNNSPKAPEPALDLSSAVRAEVPAENVESNDAEAGFGTAAEVPLDVPPVAQSASSQTTPAAEPADGEAEVSSVPTRRANTISVPAWFPGYTAALTLVMLFLLLTGRIHLSSNHVLESLPDVRPLAPNEFQEVKATQQLPRGHVLALGESRRFGDVVVTPLKVTRETLQFEDFLTGKPAPTLTTPPAYKLYLRFENVSGNAAFPPWDAALMSHRFPPFTDDLNTLANSVLFQVSEPSDEFPERLLNYMQTMDSNFVLTGQHAGKVVAPGETLETWIASEPIPDDWNPAGPLRWRIQFRKGVNSATKNGVTTLIDVNFSVSEISG